MRNRFPPLESVSRPCVRVSFGRFSWLALAAVSLLITGCAWNKSQLSGSPPADQSEQGKQGEQGEQAEQAEEGKTKAGHARGGAQLWAARCSQCHFARDPGYFSDTQWEVIMLHMRVRANLTAAEHQAILKFLKASN